MSGGSVRRQPQAVPPTGCLRPGPRFSLVRHEQYGQSAEHGATLKQDGLTQYLNYGYRERAPPETKRDAAGAHPKARTVRSGNFQ